MTSSNPGEEKNLFRLVNRRQGVVVPDNSVTASDMMAETRSLNSLGPSVIQLPGTHRVLEHSEHGVKGKSDNGAPTYPGDLQLNYADATANTVVADPSRPGLVSVTERTQIKCLRTPLDITSASTPVGNLLAGPSSRDYYWERPETGLNPWGVLDPRTVTAADSGFLHYQLASPSGGEEPELYERGDVITPHSGDAQIYYKQKII